jgi:hypothetical protein
MTIEECILGTKVSYNGQPGIIKSIGDDKTTVFVVFHCNKDWDDYKNYTGQSTRISDLRKGWLDDWIDTTKNILY